MILKFFIILSFQFLGAYKIVFGTSYDIFAPLSFIKTSTTPRLFNTIVNIRGGVDLSENDIKVYKLADSIVLQKNIYKDNVKMSHYVKIFVNDSGVQVQSFPSNNLSNNMNSIKQIDSITGDAIFGIYEFKTGHHLALVTKSESTNSFQNRDVMKVKEITFIKIPRSSSLGNSHPSVDSKNLENLLMKTFSRHTFYYCHNPSFDITRTLQYNKIINKDKKIKWYDADKKFFWNYNLVLPFTMNYQSSPELECFITPMMNAWTKTVSFNIENNIYILSLISRRSRFRQGPRYIKRGSDDDGYVANFVETEQILQNINSSVSTSFSQIRGSLPLYWHQPEIWRLKPHIKSSNDSIISQANAVRSHLIDIFNSYIFPYQKFSKKKHDNNIPLILVNLIDKKGGQLVIGQLLLKAFMYLSNRNLESNLQEAINPDKIFSKEFSFSIQSNKNQNSFTSFTQKFKYIWIDYHHMFKKFKTKALLDVYPMLKVYFESGNSYFKISGSSSCVQQGVIRTNCVDSLDRTNVMQTTIARWMLIRQFKDLGVWNDKVVRDDALTLPDEKIELLFRSLWCDNGDSISLLYAGTFALKRDVTRFGKRTNHGAIDDGINSVMRYFINNNLDPKRQIGLDFLLGNINYLGETLIHNYPIDFISQSKDIDNSDSVEKRKPVKVKPMKVVMQRYKSEKPIKIHKTDIIPKSSKRLEDFDNYSEFVDESNPVESLDGVIRQIIDNAKKTLLS